MQKPRLEKVLVKKVCMRGLPEFVIQISQPITIFCYNQGIQPLIGNSYGDQNMEDVRFFFGSGLRLSFGVTAAIYGLYYAFGPVLLTLFIKEANLFPVAYDALRMYELSTLVGSLNIVYICYFLSTQNTSPSIVIACSRGMCLNVLCIFIIPAVFGRESVWFPMIAAELITLILAVIVKKRFERRADPQK